ncbi:S4 domain-containing protein [Crenobacter caeni]|uniref:Dual-specificity RNA pseudouridine synthase RluF n=1 Tax=Crenobacter caeni TaxID=2705474 RepID=A0A6B2KVE3_9NEIS|nr:RNA pseudouridine synthase [Crenobacter caeni]NDV14010.1 hypothetical protein [Crenobacter caeni]
MSETVRLSRYLVEQGLAASRRDADESIEMGRVCVDGQLVDTLGSRVAPGQQVTLVDVPYTLPPSRVTMLANVAASADADAVLGKATRSAHDRCNWAWLSRCTGHLQEAAPLAEGAEGLRIWTQDAQLARLLSDPSRFEQEYLIDFKEAPDDAALERLAALPCKVSRQGECRIRLLLRERPHAALSGALAAASLAPLRVFRQRVGRVSLVRLENGCWRYLAPGERF